MGSVCGYISHTLWPSERSACQPRPCTTTRVVRSGSAAHPQGNHDLPETNLFSPVLARREKAAGVAPLGSSRRPTRRRPQRVRAARRPFCGNGHPAGARGEKPSQTSANSSGERPKSTAVGQRGRAIMKMGLYRVLHWCARRDSNAQPSDSKSATLSIELRAQGFVAATITFHRVKVRQWQRQPQRLPLACLSCKE